MLKKDELSDGQTQSEVSDDVDDNSTSPGGKVYASCPKIIVYQSSFLTFKKLTIKIRDQFQVNQVHFDVRVPIAGGVLFCVRSCSFCRT